MSFLTLLAISFLMDLGRKTLDVRLGKRLRKKGEGGLAGADIILRVVQFIISRSHARVIILMCQVGVGSMMLNSRVDSNIMMVTRTLEQVILALEAECTRRTNLLLPNSVHDTNLVKVRNGLNCLLEKYDACSLRVLFDSSTKQSNSHSFCLKCGSNCYVIPFQILVSLRLEMYVVSSII